jgi:methylenetetrahydrofolate reductase (NADPH)
LLEQISKEKQAGDKGKTARLLRAAKMYAIAKGLGYSGAHIGGHKLNYEMVEYIIDKGNELYPQWESLTAEFDYPQTKGFYFFEKNEKNGLNNNKPALRLSKGKRSFILGFSRVFHRTFFSPHHALFNVAQKISRGIDNSKTPKTIFEFMEHQGKSVIFDCLRCGDCALMDMAYLCPTSQCPKNQRLGPCGGSHDGWCEVYPGIRQCIWVRAYERLKIYKEEGTLGEHITPPRDWGLWQTSSWLNFYMGRDHAAVRLGIKPPTKMSKRDHPK